MDSADLPVVAVAEPDFAAYPDCTDFHKAAADYSAGIADTAAAGKAADTVADIDLADTDSAETDSVDTDCMAADTGLQMPEPDLLSGDSGMPEQFR